MQNDHEKDDNAESPMSEVALNANSSICGALAYQNLEQASDKDIVDYYIGLRRTIGLKISMYLRYYKERKIQEAREKNNGILTIEEEDRINLDILDHPINTRLNNTVHKEADFARLFTDRKDLQNLTHDDVMREVYYTDIPELEKLDVSVSAMLDEMDYPVRPIPTVAELLDRKLVQETEQELFYENEDKEEVG